MEYEVWKEPRMFDTTFDIEYFLKYKSRVVRIKGRFYGKPQAHSPRESDYGYKIYDYIDPDKWKAEKGYDYKEYQFFPHQLSERTFDYLKSPITDIVGVELDLVIADPNNNIKYISTIDFDEISEESKDAVKKCLDRIPTLEEAVMVKRINNIYDEVYTCTLKNGELKLKKAQRARSKFLGITFNSIFDSVYHGGVHYALPESKKLMYNHAYINEEDYPGLTHGIYHGEEMALDKALLYKHIKSVLIWFCHSKWKLKDWERNDIIDLLKYVTTLKEVYLSITHPNYKIDTYRCTLDENGELVLSDDTYSELMEVDVKECAKLWER